MPHAEELRLWREAARLTDDPDFGLHLAEWVVGCSEELFDVLAFALRSCATLGEHFRLAERYLRLVHQGIYLRIEEERDVVRLVHGHHEEPIPPPRRPVEAMLALLILQARRCSGEVLARARSASPTRDRRRQHGRAPVCCPGALRLPAQ